MLNIPHSFEAIAPGNDRFWRALNLREDFSKQYETLTRTLRQRIIGVAWFKFDYEIANNIKQVGCEKIAKFYDKHFDQAKSSESVSASFVDSSITINSRIFNVKECNRLLLEADAKYSIKEHPFQNIGCLQALIDRAKTEDNIVWSLGGLFDAYDMGFINSGHFSVHRLRDVRDSYIEILIMKKGAE